MHDPKHEQYYTKMRTICLGFYSDQSKGSVLIGVRIYEGARHFAIQTGSGTHPAHYSTRAGVLSREGTPDGT
jgi:hypothetical protein